MENIDWKFLIGDIFIPVALFIAGFFTGKKSEKISQAKAKVKGNNNTVTQNSKVRR